MALRLYPTNAARGGATTLVGNGSSSDIFTFGKSVKVVVQNDTPSTIYVAYASDALTAATQGDEAIPSGAELVTDGFSNAYVAIYGPAGTTVNGTASGGIVLYGV